MTSWLNIHHPRAVSPDLPDLPPRLHYAFFEGSRVTIMQSTPTHQQHADRGLSYDHTRILDSLNHLTHPTTQQRNEFLGRL